MSEQTPQELGQAAAKMLRDGYHKSFDNELELNVEEGEKFARLALAAGEVLAGLNARIEAADPSAVPIFHGIADLSDALHAFAEEP